MERIAERGSFHRWRPVCTSQAPLLCKVLSGVSCTQYCRMDPSALQWACGVAHVGSPTFTPSTSTAEVPLGQAMSSTSVTTGRQKLDSCGSQDERERGSHGFNSISNTLRKYGKNKHKWTLHRASCVPGTALGTLPYTNCSHAPTI